MQLCVFLPGIGFMASGKMSHTPAIQNWFWQKLQQSREQSTSQSKGIEFPYQVLSLIINKPFYSCLLSDTAYEWQRGSRLYGPRCFYHVNCVVVRLTSLHLHKKSNLI